VCVLRDRAESHGAGYEFARLSVYGVGGVVGRGEDYKPR